MDETFQPQETNDSNRIIPVNIEEQMKTAYISLVVPCPMYGTD
jgi:DNA gyrase subunit A